MTAVTGRTAEAVLSYDEVTAAYDPGPLVEGQGVLRGEVARRLA